MKKQGKQANFAAIIVSIIIAISIFSVGGYWIAKRFILPSFFYVTSDNILEKEVFPEIDEAELTKTQKEIIASAKAVWEEPRPESFYTDVPMNEPWCANFVSYVYREAGHPFVNPVAGGWRIPGIYTLTDYLTNEGYWHPYESGYEPVTGDIVIYDHGLMGGHTNLVLKREGDYIITLGGNEMKSIHIQKINYKDTKFGIQGFGHID